MQGLLKLIQSAEAELADWRSSEAGTEWPPSFYESCENLLNTASQCGEIGQVAPIIKALTYLIADSGPNDGGFMPSLHDVGLALEKHSRRSRQEVDEGSG